MEYLTVWKAKHISTSTDITDALDEIATSVNELCAEGWQPQGGISTIHKDHYFLAFQAMVNPEREEPK